MLKLFTELFTKKVKKNIINFVLYETFLLPLSLKSKKFFSYQQKNVEKILSYKNFLFT